MNYYLPFIPDGTLIRFPNSDRLYIKVCDRGGTGGIVAIDNWKYTKTSDLHYLDLPADDVEIIAERGAWGVHYDGEN